MPFALSQQNNIFFSVFIVNQKVSNPNFGYNLLEGFPFWYQVLSVIVWIKHLHCTPLENI